jgi:hypothetical protein
MNSIKKDDFVKAKHFKVFVFNDNGFIMMVQKKGRLDIPFGQIEPEDLDFEAAARRVVYAETKTALNPIVPVTLINLKDRSGNETSLLILAARMDGGAQIEADEKTHHRLMEERNFLMQTGYRNDAIRTLLEEAKHALFCEEVRMEHAETTQYGKEKYNYRSRL